MKRTWALGAAAVAGLLIGGALSGGALTGVGVARPAAAESKANERLAANFEVLATGWLKDSKVVPERDRKRTAKCLGQAIAADIPQEDAARLSDIFEGRAKADPALQKKWLTISKKEAPARNAQILQAVDRMCADLGPYVKQIM